VFVSALEEKFSDFLMASPEEVNLVRSELSRMQYTSSSLCLTHPSKLAQRLQYKMIQCTNNAVPPAAS
jgi:hypothetical protein